jgi:hypothetical protein
VQSGVGGWPARSAPLDAFTSRRMVDAEPPTEAMAAVALDPAAEAKAAARVLDKARQKLEKAAKEAKKAEAAEARAAAGPVKITLVPNMPVELEPCSGTRDFYPEDMRVRASISARDTAGDVRPSYDITPRGVRLGRRCCIYHACSQERAYDLMRWGMRVLSWGAAARVAVWTLQRGGAALRVPELRRAGAGETRAVQAQGGRGDHRTGSASLPQASLSLCVPLTVPPSCAPTISLSVSHRVSSLTRVSCRCTRSTTSPTLR